MVVDQPLLQKLCPAREEKDMGQVQKRMTKTKTEISWEAATVHSFKHFQDQAKGFFYHMLNLLCSWRYTYSYSHFVSLSLSKTCLCTACTTFCFFLSWDPFLLGVHSIAYSSLVDFSSQPIDKLTKCFLHAAATVPELHAQFCKTVYGVCVAWQGTFELRVCFAWQGGVEDRPCIPM